MKLLVTGGAGYIGSICVEELLNAGFGVTVLDNLSEGHRAAVDARADFVEADLADRDALPTILSRSGAEAVMHFAGNALVPESMKNPAKYFRNNFVNGFHLLDAMREVGMNKIIFSSTCAIFGTPEHTPLTEEMPKKPVNPYGESKLMFENLLRWYDELHGIRSVSLRYFNAAGATEKFGEHHRDETHLIPRLCMVALGQLPHAEIYGTDYPTPDGTCIRDYIHIVDLAQAHILALKRLENGCAAYNLGNGDGYSVRQVIEAARNITGHKIPAIEKPRRAGDPPRLVGSAEKIRKELGWIPKFPRIEQIVESAWRWHKAHPNGYRAR
jgi:UDP-glucose 4-epimerase